MGYINVQKNATIVESGANTAISPGDNSYTVYYGLDGILKMNWSYGLTSQLNSSVYFIIPERLRIMVQSVDLKIKFRLTSTPSGLQNICGLRNLITPDIDSDCAVKLWSDDTSSYEYISPTLNINDWVIFKCHIDVIRNNGSDYCTYYPSISLDNGTTWINGTSFTSSKSLNSFRNYGYFTFMNMPSASSTGDYRCFISGEIDLKGTEIKVNNELVYSFSSNYIAAPLFNPINYYSNPNIFDGLLKGSSSNGVYCDLTPIRTVYTESNVQTIEICGKFQITRSSYTENPIGWDRIFTCDPNTSTGLSVYNYGTSSRLGYYGTIALNTMYWVKCLVDWSTKTKTVSISQDGTNWTQLVSFVDSGMDYNNASYVWIGNRGGLDRPCDYTDMTGTYVKINGNLVIGYEEVN